MLSSRHSLAQPSGTWGNAVINQDGASSPGAPAPQTLEDPLPEWPALRHDRGKQAFRSFRFLLSAAFLVDSLGFNWLLFYGQPAELHFLPQLVNSILCSAAAQGLDHREPGWLASSVISTLDCKGLSM